MVVVDDLEARIPEWTFSNLSPENAYMTGGTLASFASRILSSPEIPAKINLFDEAWSLWNAGAMRIGCEMPVVQVARPSHLTAFPARQVTAQMRSLGRGISKQAKLLHSLAHHESWSIDLFADLILRSTTSPWREELSACLTVEDPVDNREQGLPRRFFSDWLQSAVEECRHFQALSARLDAAGIHYGALPTHDSLWETAQKTAFSLEARLAVEHGIQEARALDVLPGIVQRLHQSGEKEAASLLLHTVLPEEIVHVRRAMFWFRTICQSQGKGYIETFQGHARERFGYLLPPFNEEARSEAGMVPEMYLPLAKPGHPVVAIKKNAPS